MISVLVILVVAAAVTWMTKQDSNPVLRWVGYAFDVLVVVVFVAVVVIWLLTR